MQGPQCAAFQTDSPPGTGAHCTKSPGERLVGKRGSQGGELCREAWLSPSTHGLPRPCPGPVLDTLASKAWPRCQAPVLGHRDLATVGFSSTADWPRTYPTAQRGTWLVPKIVCCSMPTALSRPQVKDPEPQSTPHSTTYSMSRVGDGANGRNVSQVSDAEHNPNITRSYLHSTPTELNHVIRTPSSLPATIQCTVPWQDRIQGGTMLLHVPSCCSCPHFCSFHLFLLPAGFHLQTMWGKV